MENVGWYHFTHIADCSVCCHIQMVMKWGRLWELRLTAVLLTDLPDITLDRMNLTMHNELCSVVKY